MARGRTLAEGGSPALRGSSCRVRAAVSATVADGGTMSEAAERECSAVRDRASADGERVVVQGGIVAYPALPPFPPSKVYPELASCSWAHPSSAPNDVYEAVRSVLAEMKLDAGHFGGPNWNPLGDLVRRGGRVVVKPNMVRHWNENANGTLESVVSHWSVVRPLIDYALLAVGESGQVVVGDAPHWDCDIAKLRDWLGVGTFEEHYAKTAPGRVHFIDFRPEWFEAYGPVKGEPIPLPGDPEGYATVDLASLSEFYDSRLDPRSYCGSGYDNRATVRAHSDGRHAYKIAASVLRADLFINVPKLKTHHLLGLTVAMKNLVGIAGDKNLLPHFRRGFPAGGGDQYPRPTPNLLARYVALQVLLPLLARNRIGRRLWGAFLKTVHAVGGRNPCAGGAWIGNDTVWRTALDLNRALIYASADGTMTDAPQRRQLVLVDGVVGGEGDGPMRPLDRHCGLLVGAASGFLCDTVCAQIMGFNGSLLPLLQRGRLPHRLPLAPEGSMERLMVSLRPDLQHDWTTCSLSKVPNQNFAPPPAWADLKAVPRESPESLP